MHRPHGDVPTHSRAVKSKVLKYYMFNEPELMTDGNNAEVLQLKQTIWPLSIKQRQPQRTVLIILMFRGFL